MPSILLAALVGSAQAGCSGPTPEAAAAWPEGRRMPHTLRPHPSPGLAATLSIVPGLGHVYVCDWQGMGVSAGATFGGIILASQFASDGLDSDDPLVLTGLFASQNAWFYSVYDSWRVARLARGPHEGKLPVDGARMRDHLAAPFKRESLRDPWIIGAAALGATLAVATTPGGDPIWSQPTVPWSGQDVPTGVGVVGGELVWASIFSGVGPGEEGLFRGVVQPTLVEYTGTVPGIIGTAMLFGAAHYSNGGGDVQQGLMTSAITGTIGLGLGVMAHHDRYELRRPIAAHFWYDMAVATTTLIIAPDDTPWAVNYGGSF